MMRVYSAVVIVIFVAALTSVAGFAGVAVYASTQRNDTARSAAQLYRRYCVSCHGSDGRAKTSKGKFSHARDFTEAQWQDDVTDERIFNSIMNGRSVRGNMPAFSNKLNQEEANALVKFVRGLRG
ncbi:MAG TPA: c-type cytochrome [Pyrinomonadaceae bacterium]|nr:c-type cytochrome [Pyrinomonadaceae bacterium]